MQFLFCEKGGQNPLVLDGESFNYLFKVRRHRKDNPIRIRTSENPETLFTYRVNSIGRREANLELIETQESSEESGKLSVAWCLPTIKTVEKTLPMLNELGVKKLTLIRCDFSQGNFKVDIERLNSILKNSSMQSGRIYPMRVEVTDSLEQYLKSSENIAVLDFVDEVLSSEESFKTLLIGSEGGFSEDERELFSGLKISRRRLPSNHILKSETAVISAVSRTL